MADDDLVIIGGPSTPTHGTHEASLARSNAKDSVWRKTGVFLNAHSVQGQPQQRHDDGHDDDEDNDEASCCIICFEPWTASGRHRIVSLKCGHLFGRSCIEKWLNSSSNPVPKCPKCNAPARRSDIRVLFVPRRLAAVDDNGKEERLMRLLEDERKNKQLVVERERSLMEQVKLLKIEIVRLNEELARLKNDRLELGTPNRERRFVKYQFARQCSLGEGSRTMVVDSHYRQIVIVRGNQLVRVSIDSASAGNDPLAQPHDAAIKGVACGPFRDGLVASVGIDARLRLSSLQTGTQLAMWGLLAPGWSVAFDRRDRNVLFVGLGNRRISVFDLRQTGGPLLVDPLVVDSGLPPLPVHSLAVCAVHADKSVLVGATMNGVFVSEPFSEITASLVIRTVPLSGVSGVCSGLSSTPDGHYFIAAFRHNNPSIPLVLVVFSIASDGDEDALEGQLSVKRVFQAASGSARLVNPVLFADAPERLTAAVIDDRSWSVHLWDLGALNDPDDKATLRDTISCNAARPLQSVAVLSGSAYSHALSSLSQSPTSSSSLFVLSEQQLFMYKSI